MLQQPAKYPFFGHVVDAAAGLKALLQKSGLWLLQSVAVPTQLKLPTQDTEELNKFLLLEHLGPDGLPPLPAGVGLWLEDKDMKSAKAWSAIAGPPPNQSGSLFFDESPFQTWYLQGKGHWAYALPHP